MIDRLPLLFVVFICAAAPSLAADKSAEALLEQSNKVLAKDPKNGAAYNSRGIAYNSLSRPELAIADYTSALVFVRGKDKAKSYSNRGRVYADLREDELAMADFDKAISIDSGDAIFWRNRANLWALKGEYAKAKSDIDKAISLKPETSRGYLLRALTFVDLEQYDNALADFDRAIRLEPDNGLFLSLRGKTRAFMQDGSGAETDLALAKNKARLDPDVWEASCTGYLFLGKLPEALTDCNESIRLGSDDHSMRGIIYLKDDQWEVARKEFDHALAKNPQRRSLAQYGRALVARHDGDEALANKLFDRVKELNPHAPDEYAKYYGLTQ